MPKEETAIRERDDPDPLPEAGLLVQDVQIGHKRRMEVPSYVLEEDLQREQTELRNSQAL